VRALRLSWISPAASPPPGYPENSPQQGPRPRVPTPIGCTLLKSVPLGILPGSTCKPEIMQQRGAIIGCFHGCVNIPSAASPRKWGRYGAGQEAGHTLRYDRTPIWRPSGPP